MLFNLIKKDHLKTLLFLNIWILKAVETMMKEDSLDQNIERKHSIQLIQVRIQRKNTV